MNCFFSFIHLIFSLSSQTTQKPFRCYRVLLFLIKNIQRNVQSIRESNIVDKRGLLCWNWVGAVSFATGNWQWLTGYFPRSHVSKPHPRIHRSPRRIPARGDVNIRASYSLLCPLQCHLNNSPMLYSLSITTYQIYMILRGIYKAIDRKSAMSPQFSKMYRVFEFLYSKF